MPEQQSNYQSILTEIRKLAKSHYDTNDKPLFLSSLGDALLKIFPDLKSALQDRSLSSAVQDLSDMVLIRHSRSPQRVAVAFAEDSARVQEQVETFSSSTKQSAALQHNRIQRALVFAFQQAPTDEQEVYVSLGPPIRYHVIHKTSPQSKEDLVLIPKNLLVPNNPFLDMEVLPVDKRNALLTNIRQWTATNNIPFQLCYYVRRTGGSNNLLLKFIDAQPAEIRSRLVIPAEIVLKLLARD